MLIPQISHQFDNPQRIPGNTTLSRLWLKRSLLMFASSESPQKGLANRCHHLANRNHVGISHLMTLFLRFYNRMRIPHFYYPFLLQLASMCDLTICWGHVGNRGRQARESRSPSSSPRLRGPAYSLAPTGKGVQPVWEPLDPDLVLSCNEVPTH